jgi:hypothetical protein
MRSWHLGHPIGALSAVAGSACLLACATFPPEPKWENQLSVQQRCFSHILEPWEFVEARELSGVVVTDASQSSGFSGAVVFARLAPGGEVFRTVTDESGRFHFSDLGSGIYEVAACLDGFNPWRGHVRVRRAGPHEALRLVLTLGA